MWVISKRHVSQNVPKCIFFLNGGTNIQRGLLQVLFNIVKMSLTSKVTDTFGYFAKTGSCYVRI